MVGACHRVQGTHIGLDGRHHKNVKQLHKPDIATAERRTTDKVLTEHNIDPSYSAEAEYQVQCVRQLLSVLLLAHCHSWPLMTEAMLHCATSTAQLDKRRSAAGHLRRVHKPWCAADHGDGTRWPVN